MSDLAGGHAVLAGLPIWQRTEADRDLIVSSNVKPGNQTTGRTAAQIAASVGAEAGLADVLADLFEGVDAMGSMPGLVVAALRAAGFTKAWRVLDLASGKGVPGVAIASSLGCFVTGIDAHAEFVDAANRAARAAGVSDRCTFRVGDIHARRAPGRFDGAIMIGLLGAEDAVPLLRSLVRPNGVYAFDDAMRAPGTRRSAVPSLADIRRLIRSRGDQVIAARLIPKDRVGRQCERTIARLEANARALGVANPKLTPSLRRFLAAQHKAARLLAGPLRPALVVARRG